jgi:hypothetical protein
MNYQEIEGHRNRFERLHGPKIRRVMEDEGEAFARAIEEEDFPVSAFVKTDEMQEALTALWSDVIPFFARQTLLEIEAMKQAEEMEDEWLRLVRRFVETDGGVMIAGIRQTTLKIVRAIVDEGIVEGWGFRKIASELRKQWGEISRVRSERIVRTESVRASSYGASESAKAARDRFGLELEKVWVSVEDDRTRASHVALNGTAVPIDGFFDVEGHPAQYPGDPALPPEQSIQCRCALIHRVKEAKSWRDERDDRIRSDFPPLMRQWGKIQALEELAERESISPRQVRRIVYDGTRK